MDSPAAARSSLLRSLGRLLALALLGGVAIAACGDDDHGSAPVTRDALPDRLAALLCERRTTCGCDDSPTARDACRQQATVSHAGLLPTLTDPRSYDGACAGRFVEAAAALPCSTDALYVSTSLLCSLGCTIESGTVPLGEECAPSQGYEPQGVTALSSPCAPGLACRSSYACSGDVCTSRWTCQDACAAPVGASCTQRSCTPDASCQCANDGCVNGPVCVALPSLGEPCPQGSCAAGLACQYDTAAQTLRCVSRFADGTGCSGVDQCLSGFCPDGVCRPRPGPGEACVQGVCPDGLTCHEGVCSGRNTAACQSL